MPTTIFVASAGTGKTTALMDHLELALQESSPDRIMFTTFTNAGADEAIERALSNHPQHSREDFRYFRTMHSIAYRAIPYRKMINRADLAAFGREIGYPISGTSMDKQEGITARMLPGDVLIALDSIARSSLMAGKQVAGMQDSSHFPPETIDEFIESYRKYRRSIRKYDFTDQLENYRNQLLHNPLTLDWLFVDEAQDLSTLQWAIVKELSKTTKRVVIAGDDKQSIYKFTGADPQNLIDYEGERIVLQQSYRLPEIILNLAEKVADRIQVKQTYTVTPATTGGEVTVVADIRSLDLSKDTWFFLARNRKFLPFFEQDLLKQQYLFVSDGNSILPENLLPCIQAWEELRMGHAIPMSYAKEVYRNYLPTGPGVKRGFKKILDAMNDRDFVTKDELINNYGLQDTRPALQSFNLPPYLHTLLTNTKDDLSLPPRIKLSTIHGVKGQEADHVVVLPDMSPKTWSHFHRDPDSEHRVFYVGITRARKTVYLHKPLTNESYNFPT